MPRTIAALLASLLLLATNLAQAAEGKDSRQKAILVTGASTGIGRSITERLAADGHIVYAGARKDADLEALAKIPNVRPLRLDVTKPEDIDAAVKAVETGGLGLHGLVNNAGIATIGSIANQSMDEFDLVMKVNVYGPMRMTKAFLPLIVESKGRIATISSLSGILAPKDLAAYAMSKHAIEAFGDALAAEVAPLGVSASLIEPGNYDSDIGKSAAKRLGAESRLADRSKYAKPDAVAAAVERALFEPTPKPRYLVVPNEREAQVTIGKQIEELAQLNEGQPYTYDRDALVKMLDEALAKSRPKTP